MTIYYKVREKTKGIILHDSHTVPGKVTGVERWQQEAFDGALKMGLLSIGYHYIIEDDGAVVECRPPTLIGSHAPTFNMEWLGICLVGGRDEEGGPGRNNFTGTQYRALLRLINELDERFGPGLEVKGHSELQRFRNRSLPPCPPLDMDLVRDDVQLFKMGYYVNEN